MALSHKLFIFTLLFFSSVFIFSKSVKATQDIIFTTGFDYSVTGDGAFSRQFVGSNLTLDNDETATAIQFYSDASNGGIVKPYLCTGTITNTTEARDALMNCNYINSYDDTPNCSYGWVEHGTSTCYFDRSYNVDAGNYYIILEAISTNDNKVWVHNALSNLNSDAELFGTTDNVGYYYGSYDLIFSLLNDDSYGTYTPTTTLDYTATNEQGESITINNLTGNAFFSASNIISYSYNNLAIGSEVNIIMQTSETEYNIDINDAYETDELTTTPLGNNKSFIASTTLTQDGTQFYCVVLDSQHGETYDIYICGIRRDWYTDNISQDFDDYLNSRMATSSWCNCDDIATSTGIFTELVSDFQCSARKTACWLFFPKDFSTLTSAINKFKNGFPFSVVGQIKDQIDTSISTAQTTNETIVIAPLMWAGEETGVNLLTNKTLEQGMGAYLYDKYYTWFTYLIYLFGIMYFLRRILKLSDSFDYRFKRSSGGSSKSSNSGETYGRSNAKTAENRKTFKSFASKHNL